MAAAKPTVAIVTGSSNTGLAVIEFLQSKYADKVNVRAVVRATKDVATLKKALEAAKLPAVEIVIGDLRKPLMLQPVFAGVNAAYLSTPSTEDRVALAKLFFDACLEHGVKFGVVISMLCADQKATTFQRQFAEIEEYAASKSGKAVKLAVGDKGKELFHPVVVRSAPFFQNLYGSIAGIGEGKLYYPLAEGSMPHVDLVDVAKVIGTILVNPAAHINKTYNCVAEYQAGNMLASTIGMKVGKPCTYENVDDQTAAMAFELLGLPAWQAEGNVETLRFFRTGHGLGVASDITALTGDRTAKFSDFVRDKLKPMLG